MAFEFLFASKPKAQFKGINVISFDASLSESHVYEAQVTTNPVETGANISDNILINPVALNITGFITDTPLKFFQGLRNKINGSGELSKTAHDQLVELFNSRQKFEVVTGLAVYKDMILKRLTFPRDNKTGKAIRFDCQLVQIILADFETTDINEENISDTQNTKNQGSEKVDLAKKNIINASAEETKKGSLAYNAFN